MSLPVRGAWVEMGSAAKSSGHSACRSPCGERGLKLHSLVEVHGTDRRSPCGERGLKSLAYVGNRYATTSLPVRGAWVEIKSAMRLGNSEEVAPRAGSVG